MSAPILQSIFPNDGQTSVPIRADIEITFDVGIDPNLALRNIALYGPDFDRTSGPDSALWIDGESGANPFFLTSPGYQGRVPFTLTTVYVKTDGTLVDPQPTFADRAAELASGYYQKVIVTPDNALAPLTEYTVYMIGDSEAGTDSALSARTIFDVDCSAVISATSFIQIYGGYTGTADTVNVKVTLAGDIGAAKYKWWYDSELEADARTGKITSRRYRNLEDGLQIRFSGSGFLLGDTYTFAVYPPDYLATSYSWSFTTGTGSIEEVPTTASTSVIGTVTSIAPTYLEVVSMTPGNGSWHQTFSNATITIEFSEDLGADTVTDSTVSVYAYPVSGDFRDGPSSTSYGPYTELFKKLTVTDNILTIEV